MGSACRCVLLGLGFVVVLQLGCSSDSTDPGNRDGRGGGTSTGAKGGTSSGGTSSGGTASGGMSSGGTASGGTASGGTASGGTSSGGTSSGGTSSGGTGGSGQCPPAQVTFVGQITAPDNKDVPNGGKFTTSASEAAYVDAGLEAVVAAAQGATAPKAVTLDVNGAVVVATSYHTTATIPPSKSSFWLADAKGAIEVRLDYQDTACCASFDIRVGHKLKLKVTEVKSYFGTPQISKASDWTLVAPDQFVLVEEPARALVKGDALKMVRLTGTVGGTGSACGGQAKCWSLSHGNGAYTVPFRSSSKFVKAGQCTTWVGPVSLYNSKAQLNVVNFDWAWTYK